MRFALEEVASCRSVQAKGSSRLRLLGRGAMGVQRVPAEPSPQALLQHQDPALLWLQPRSPQE